MWQTVETYENVLLQKKDHIGKIVFNRPDQRNNVSVALSQDMSDLLEKLRRRRDMRAVIVTGSGNAFCAGMNLKEFQSGRNSMATARRLGEHMSTDWWRALRNLPQVTVAAVNGHTFGGGLIVLSCCDLAIAAEDAPIGLSEINWGGFPAGGATRIVLEDLPRKHAAYLVLMGDPIDGREAARIGFVNKAVPRAELDGAAEEWANKLARHHPTVMEWAKKVIAGSYQIIDHDLAVAWEGAMSAQMSQLVGGSGSRKGWQAFIDKQLKPGMQAMDFSEEEWV